MVCWTGSTGFFSSSQIKINYRGQDLLSLLKFCFPISIFKVRQITYAHPSSHKEIAKNFKLPFQVETLINIT